MKAAHVYLLVGLVVAAAALIAIPARATYGARTTADEPQYLLSALSLAEDRDLWIDDELATRAHRPFHEAQLPAQTATLANGHDVSPHDPLLPVVLAVPMGLGGWVAAKATLAVLAGALAGLLTWIAHRRFAVPMTAAAVTVLAFGLTPPLSAYATQVYPELPAALLFATGIAVLTQPGSLSSPRVVVLAGAVALLPWLGVKYALVAAALAALTVVRLWRAQQRVALTGVVVGWGLAGVVYLVAHRLIYGGWTVYAAGDHFVGGELTVVGSEPNYQGRSRRLVGLLLDRGFGLAAWMPGYLLAVPALAALIRRRPAGWAAIVVPLAAGWATATWVALTMHGWWWPGRQTVVVVPALVLGVAWWVGQAPARRMWVMVATGAVGATSWLWLVVEVLRRRRTLIVDFEATGNPLYQAWRWVLPDYRDPGPGDWLLQALWLLALGGAALLTVRGRPRSIRATTQRTTQRRRPTHVPA